MRPAGARWRRVRWPMPAIGPARGRSAREAVIVAVRAADGATGLGEAAPLPGMSRDHVAVCERALAAALETLPAVVSTRDEACAIAAALADTPAARFALEAALLVTIAQRARGAVASLWSGAATGRELSCAVVVDDEADARATGARCLKIKVGGEEGDRARVERIARAAPHARLRLDANRSWPRGEVAERMAELRDVARGAIEYVEEPCPGAHELLDEELPLRIALDESLGELSEGELARALRCGPERLAALVLKPTLLGGFARCLELAEAARRHGVAAIASHALEGPIGTAACAEVARVIAADVEVGLAPHPGLARWSEAEAAEAAEAA